MTRFALIASLMVLSSPAAANFGDVNADLDRLAPQIVTVSQPLQIPTTIVAVAGSCRLPSEHIVAVPSSFSDQTPVEVACLTGE